VLQSRDSYYVVTSLYNETGFYSKLFQDPVQQDVLEGSLVGVIGLGETFDSNETVLLESSTQSYSFSVNDFTQPIYQELKAGWYAASILINSTYEEPVWQKEPFSPGNRGAYTLVVQPNQRPPSATGQNQWQMTSHMNIHPNSVSVWAQLPQYVVISVGEVLFAVTGLRFAYDQAPPSMKSVVQAGWLLTTAFGNLIDVIVAGVHLINQVGEFFFFAVLMAVTTVIFALMTTCYTYVSHSHIGSPRDAVTPRDDVTPTRDSTLRDVVTPSSGTTNENK